MQLLFIKLSINLVSPNEFNIVIITQTFMSLSGIFDLGQPVIAQTFALKSGNSYLAFTKSSRILLFSLGLLFVFLLICFFVLQSNYEGILTQYQIFNILFLLGISASFFLIANLAVRISFVSRFGYVLSSVLALPPIMNFVYAKYFLKVYSGFNLSLIVLSTFLFSSILTLMLFIKRFYKERKKYISQNNLEISQSKLLKQGLKVWGASAMGSLILQSDNFILMIVAPSYLVQYYLAMKFANVYLFILSLDLPRIFTQISIANSLNKFKNIMKKHHIKISLVTILTFLSIKFLTSLIWADSNVSIILSFLVSLYVFLRSSSDFFSFANQAIEEYKLLLKYLPFQLLITYLFSLLLVPKMGSVGMVMSHLIAFTSTASWILPYYFFKNYKVKKIS